MRGLPKGSRLVTRLPTSQGNPEVWGTCPLPAMGWFPERIQGVSLAAGPSWGIEVSLPVSPPVCILPGFPVAFVDKV